MTFVRYEKRFSKVDSLGRTWRKTIAVLVCDECGIEFERFGPCVGMSHTHALHFHHADCHTAAKRPGGKLRAAVEKSCMERFGAASPLCNAATDCRIKAQKTLQQKYGVDSIGKALTVKAKIAETNRQRYGASSILGCKAVRSTWDYRAAAVKGFETMKRNGTYRKSRSEDTCYELLCETFGAHDVTRQVSVNRWPIDFYVTSIDTYVQFDGVYWHGLDRPLEEITQYRTKRDRQIHVKWLIDQQQNKWFDQNGLKLVRITDEQLDQSPSMCVDLIRQRRVNQTKCA